MIKVGFIGCGNMGGALAKAVSKAENVLVYLYDYNLEKAEEMAKNLNGKVSSSSEIVSVCDFVFLGVKPNVLPSVLNEIKNNLNANTTLISMAAGVKISSIEEIISTNPIIRIMPNTPVFVGRGMTVYASNLKVDSAREQTFLDIMAHTGKVDKLQEDLIDSFCAVASCGPAFCYMFIEALTKGGEKCGLPREKALLYASEMVKGSSYMVLKGDETPNKLRDNVCSPNGSTIEGVKSLQKDSFDEIVENAVIASYNRTVELGKQK